MVMWLIVMRIGEAANPGPGRLGDPEDFADVNADLETEVAAEAAALRQMARQQQHPWGELLDEQMCHAADSPTQQETPQPLGDNTQMGTPSPGGSPLTGGPSVVGPSGPPGSLQQQQQRQQGQQGQFGLAADNMELSRGIADALANKPAAQRQLFLDLVAERRRGTVVRRQLELQAGSVANVERAPPFEPAARHDGCRLGLSFKLGELGLGYYADSGKCRVELAPAIEAERSLTPVTLQLRAMLPHPKYVQCESGAALSSTLGSSSGSGAGTRRSPLG